MEQLHQRRKNRERDLYTSFGETAFFKLLHMAFPGLPPFDSKVCGLYREDGQCAGIKGKYMLHLEALGELAGQCNENPVIKALLGFKSFAKIVDQAAWLVHTNVLESNKEAMEVLAELKKLELCPADAEDVLRGFFRQKGGR